VPELPEVETVCRGIRPHILSATVCSVTVRVAQLRYPIPPKLSELLTKKKVIAVRRRGKYILLQFSHGYLIMHLGMSGVLRIVDADTPLQRHDHLDIAFDSGVLLRLNDTRRFGMVAWHKGEDLTTCRWFLLLGVEPLSDSFDTDYLKKILDGKQRAIKLTLMDSYVVVGIGNIYANEILFASGIHPATPANLLSDAQRKTLVATIKSILNQAIKQGGTTLKDFKNASGKPGYFAQQLQVYGRDGEHCYQCNMPIRRTVMGQRATFFCPTCQPVVS
jgi:formamidopyrimidine-DNA glycosylase